MVLLDAQKMIPGHALVGDYPDINMDNCGYRHPNDKTNANNAKPDIRIIDGQTATLGEFPWMASLYTKQTNDYKHICGGILIHKFWVLTHKRCIFP